MDEQRPRALVLVAVVALAVVWGTQYLVIRVARADASAELAVALRFFFVAAVGQVLVVTTAARAPRGHPASRIAVGVCQAISMLLLYRAERDVESAWASLLMATSPFFVVGLAAVWVPEERVTRAIVAALGVGFAGAALLVGPLRGTANPGALGMLLGAAVFAALAKVLARKLAPVLPAVVMLRDLGLVVLLVVAPFALDGGLALTMKAALAHAYLGLVASAAATGVYFWLLRQIPVTRLAYLPFASAAVGVAAGVTAGEKVEAGAWAGTSLVLLGGLILVWPRRWP